MFNNFVKNEIKEIIVYIFLGVFTAIIIPIVVGFAFLGFQESFVSGASLVFGSLLVTFIIYIVFTVATFALILFPIASIITLKEGEDPATKPNPTWFRIFTVSYLFSPENGLLYKMFESFGFSKERNPMRFTFNFLRVVALSILVFWLLGIVQVINPSLQFTGVPSLHAQQVTVTSDVLFVSLIPAWSETMTLLFILFLILGCFAYLTSKYVKDKNNALIYYFALSIFIGCTITALIWGGLHRIVYGSSDIALVSTLVFGFVGSLLTIASGTFIPFWVWHLFNNVYARLAKLVPANQDILFISFVLYFIFFGFYLFMEYLAWKSRKKKRYDIENSF